LIKFLQDAVGKGELDPWDIDVISVIDSFLEEYSNTFNQSSNSQISYQKDLAETSEAFFAASVLVNLKAQVLESDVFKENSSDFEDVFDLDDQDWIDKEFDFPILFDLPIGHISGNACIPLGYEATLNGDDGILSIDTPF